mgnify:CR=1 FL=1
MERESYADRAFFGEPGGNDGEKAMLEVLKEALDSLMPEERELAEKSVWRGNECL